MTTIVTDLKEIDNDYFPLAQVLLAEETADGSGCLRVKDNESGNYVFVPFVDLVVPYQDGLGPEEFLQRASFTCMQFLDNELLRLLDIATAKNSGRNIQGSLTLELLQRATKDWPSGTFGCVATADLIRSMDPALKANMAKPAGDHPAAYVGASIIDSINKVAAIWALDRPESVAYVTNSPLGVVSILGSSDQYEGKLAYKYSFAMMIFGNNVWAVKP